MSAPREFEVETPIGKLKVYAKHETDTPEDFPGVFVDFIWPSGEQTLLTCVEYDSVTKKIQSCVYQNSWEDEPTEVVEHHLKEECNMREWLIREAENCGMEMAIYQLIDELHRLSFWYGGTIAKVKKGGLTLEISARGDVYASLLIDGQEQAEVRDKRNDGLFYEVMKGYIPDDESLLLLLKDDDADANTRLVMDNNNWYEWTCTTENGNYVGPVMLDNIFSEDDLFEILRPENLLEIYAYIEQYELERNMDNE